MLQRGVGGVQQEAKRRVLAGARAKGPQTESLQRARVWFGQVSLGLYSPLRCERGFGGNLPSGDVEGLWGLSHAL